MLQTWKMASKLVSMACFFTLFTWTFTGRCKHRQWFVHTLSSWRSGVLYKKKKIISLLACVPTFFRRNEKHNIKGKSPELLRCLQKSVPLEMLILMSKPQEKCLSSSLVLSCFSITYERNANKDLKKKIEVVIHRTKIKLVIKKNMGSKAYYLLGFLSLNWIIISKRFSQKRSLFQEN